MLQAQNQVRFRVWGDFACFTRPEFKAERLTYDVITPSAARGIIEAIYWKPEFRWVIKAIHVHEPIAYFSMMRNELALPQRPNKPPMHIEDKGVRTQRTTRGLRNVAYTIIAEIQTEAHETHSAQKHVAIANRYIQAGACFHRPYLGCREYVAHFAPAYPAPTINVTRDLGPMLHHLEYEKVQAAQMSFNFDTTTNTLRPHKMVTGRAKPHFFYARLQKGVLIIPPDKEVEEQTDGWENFDATE